MVDNTAEKSAPGSRGAFSAAIVQTLRPVRCVEAFHQHHRTEYPGYASSPLAALTGKVPKNRQIWQTEMSKIGICHELLLISRRFRTASDRCDKKWEERERAQFRKSRFPFVPGHRSATFSHPFFYSVVIASYITINLSHIIFIVFF